MVVLQFLLLPCTRADSVMLTFGKAVYGSGVGRKIVDMLEVDEKELGQQLPTSEQQYKGERR